MTGQNVYFIKLYQDADRLLLQVLTALLVVSCGLAPVYDTWIAAVTIGLPAWAVCAWLVRYYGGALVTRCAIAAALMVFASLQIDQAHGMIEMHFGIFVLLAFLLYYRDWVPLVFAAAVIAVLHLAFDLLQRAGQPFWVFASVGGFGIVLVHAAFVVIETALLVWMAIQLRVQIEAMGGDPTELSRASRELANGNLTVEIHTTGASPNSLVCAMESMRAELKTKIEREAAMMATIAQQNATLEHRVAERTAELSQKTSDINAMLQNMAVGVSTVIPGNVIHPEYSNYLRTIFSIDDVGGKELIASLFAKSSLGVDVKDQITAALSAILGEDPAMFTFNSHLLPAEMSLTGDDGTHKIVQMDWSPILNDHGAVDKVLLITQDVTHLRELEESSAHQQEELEIISKIIRISVGKFNELIASAVTFIAANRSLITATQIRDPEVISALFRNMHTIKGNARTFEFTQITDVAHHAEQTYDRLRKDDKAEWNAQVMLTELDAVAAAVAHYVKVNEETLGRKGRASDLLTTRGAFVGNNQLAELRSMAAALIEAHPGADVVQMRNTVDKLGLISLSRLVSGASDSVSSLASELKKPTPALEIVDGDIAFNSQFAEALKSCCMHILRNSLDHGIEAPADRILAHKHEQGTVRFACERHGDQIELHISDDGQGLAMHKLFEKGLAAGLFKAGESPTRDALADTIFRSGLSTSARVTQLSGRGVGMDAVRTFLKEQGATIRIALNEPSDTELGFAPFEFVINVPVAAYSH